MKGSPLFWITLFCCIACQAQPAQESQRKAVGGPCEGCEALFEFGDRVLMTVDSLPEFELHRPKLKISGTVFQKDGQTPASDIILYIYHTNKAGIYDNKENEPDWAKRHGYYRGWVKTGKTGQYTFYTFRPGAYPNGREAEHIHLTVLEPGMDPYYMDSFVFEDDPLLTLAARRKLNNRGGSGIVHPVLEGNLFLIQRDIILGKNIPNYD